MALEISDYVIAFDPNTLKRRRVKKEPLRQLFLKSGQKWGARIIAKLPEEGGFLDEPSLDQLILSVHCEMQRLSEEFQHGQRMFEVLAPLVHALRKEDAYRRLTVVDVGCGMGYVTRWLARYFAGDGLRFIGVDLNRVLISEARRLAELEGLRCEFLQGDAFQLESPGDIYTSTGVLHHFADEDLPAFFAKQKSALGFIHMDFQPSAFAAIGAWLFHVIRMRNALAVHDGTYSACRSKTAEVLVEKARQGIQNLKLSTYSRFIGSTPVRRVFQAILGVHPDYVESFQNALGRRASRLEGWQ